MNRRKMVNDRQMTLPFEYNTKVKELSDRCDEVKKDLDDLITLGPDRFTHGEDEASLCNEIAAAVTADLRKSGMSREQLVDRINEFFGRTEAGASVEPQECRKPLSINTMNNYLTKPYKYPLPSHLQIAISHIFGTFSVQRVIVEALGGKVISGEDVRRLAQMKIRELKDQVGMMERMI